jgi:UDP-glucuronate decarboxylase
VLDEVQRCPDIRLAKERLGWEPTVRLQDGLSKTITYFERLLKNENVA